MRIFYERRLGVLEDLDCGSAADRWKVFKEDLNGIACFQVLEEDSYRYARAHEDGSTSHDFGV